MKKTRSEIYNSQKVWNYKQKTFSCLEKLKIKNIKGVFHKHV